MDSKYQSRKKIDLTVVFEFSFPVELLFGLFFLGTTSLGLCLAQDRFCSEIDRHCVVVIAGNIIFDRLRIAEKTLD